MSYMCLNLFQHYNLFNDKINNKDNYVSFVHPRNDRFDGHTGIRHTRVLHKHLSTERHKSMYVLRKVDIDINIYWHTDLDHSYNTKVYIYT